MSGGVGEAGVLYGAPMFETGDQRYAWLNRVQALFRGVVAGDGMFYDEYFGDALAAGRIALSDHGSALR